MHEVGKYVISRILIFCLEIIFALSLCFIILRLGPTDPIMEIIARITSMSEYIDPSSAEHLKETLSELFGLKGTLLDQYRNFIIRSLKGDFGPSYSVFPTPVIEIIQRALPWTVALLFWTTVVGWILGNIIGGIAGIFKEKGWAKLLAGFAISIYPVPYYILALLLVFLLAYIFQIFPLGGAGAKNITFSLDFFLKYVQHAFLPGVSLVLGSYGWWFISMRNISMNTRKEDYVLFAEAQGLSKRVIIFKYILRNSLLPQITGLAINLGGILNGALATEVLFEYPGMGYILYVAVTRADFNLMLGILVYSTLAVAAASLIIDLVYPFIDPRIRYK
jgi:peptide/nickel transport system permease protein